MEYMVQPLHFHFYSAGPDIYIPKKNRNVLKQKFEPELISVINLSGRNSGPSRKSGMSDQKPFLSHQ